jgi:hypothetical protein
VLGPLRAAVARLLSLLQRLQGRFPVAFECVCHETGVRIHPLITAPGAFCLIPPPLPGQLVRPIHGVLWRPARLQHRLVEVACHWRQSLIAGDDDVLIDRIGSHDLDLLVAPAELVSMVPPGMLPLPALGMGEPLRPRRLPEVDHRLAVQMVCLEQLGRRPRSPHSARGSGRQSWAVAGRWGGFPTPLRVGETEATRVGRGDHLGDGLERAWGGRGPYRPRPRGPEGQTHLDGLEARLRTAFPRDVWNGHKQVCPKVNFIRLADDFVITGATKELLEDAVKPLVETFLKERGRQLSPEKTVITHIAEGFDVLGQHLRKSHGTLLIKPSAKRIKTVLRKGPICH